MNTQSCTILADSEVGFSKIPAEKNHPSAGSQPQEADVRCCLCHPNYHHPCNGHCHLFEGRPCFQSFSYYLSSVKSDAKCRREDEHHHHGRARNGKGRTCFREVPQHQPSPPSRGSSKCSPVSSSSSSPPTSLVSSSSR